MGNPIVELDAGEHAVIGSIIFHGIPAAHNTLERDAEGYCRFLGYVALLSGKSFYHSGDTMLYDGLIPALEAFQPDVAFVPINGSKPERRVAGNMNGREAASLARAIDAGVAVPHHFDLFEFNTASPQDFETECRRLGQSFRTLQNGEGMDF